jgi:hypothetical protein
MTVKDWTDIKIVNAINNDGIESDDLVSRDSWSYIC